MTGQSDPLALASEFPPATHESWRSLVDAALKGASFDKKLVRRTHDGLAIQPLYPRATHATPVAGRPHGMPWQIMQRVDHPDAAAANAQCLEDMQNGATGLALTFAGSIGAHGYGVAGSSTDIAAALDGVFIDAVAVELDLPIDGNHIAALIADTIKQRGIVPAEAQLRFGIDPLGALAVGTGNADWKDTAAKFVRAISTLRDAGFAGPLAVADGRVIHNAGGSEAQELAYVLAAGVTYLRALADSGFGLDAARDTLFFRLSADAQQFLTVAKFRAIRKLWGRVEEASSLAPKPIFVSAETAWRMMTRRDPWVNVLRSTVATVSAGLGGANAMTVLPFTLAIGLPDAFARRLARNTQSVLLEESHLAKVSDPAAGSGAIEDITAQLCGAAWALFQKIERAGGLPAALASRLVQRNVALVREKRTQAVANRGDALTGTSEFPHLTELPVAVLAPTLLAPPPKRGRSMAEGHREGVTVPVGRNGPPPQPSPFQGAGEESVGVELAPLRLAEPYERLRDASDVYLATTGKRPQIFLANLGKPADFTARATFAKNLFEAGGIEAITNDGFADAEGLASAFRASGAALICLCSSDAIYVDQAMPALQALKSAGAEAIYLAGKPTALGDQLVQSGVKTVIYAGCDALAILQGAHDIIGMTAGAPN